MKFKPILGAVVVLGTMMLASVTAHAATFTAGKNTLPAGGGCEITISVKGDDASETLNGFILNVGYNKDYVSMEQADGYNYAVAEDFCQEGILVSDVISDPNTKLQTGKGVIAWASASPIAIGKNDVPLVTLRFESKDAFTSGSTDITLKLTQLSYKGTSADDPGKTENGSVTVGGTVVIYGDVNGDGRVNVEDASTILRYHVGIESLAGAQKEAADVNADNTVNVEDAMYIAQYHVGNIKEFPAEK